MSEAYWENLYQAGDMRWEKGAPSPGLVDFLATQRDLPGETVCVPGGGTGHDAHVKLHVGNRPPYIHNRSWNRVGQRCAVWGSDDEVGILVNRKRPRPNAIVSPKSSQITSASTRPARHSAKGHRSATASIASRFGR